MPPLSSYKQRFYKLMGQFNSTVKKRDTAQQPLAAQTESSKITETVEPSKFRMVALDLDGTLLNSNHHLSEETKACIRRLDQKGFTVIIATGRGPSTVFETIKSLNLPKPIHLVCSNGADGLLCSVVEDGEGGSTVETETVFSTPVPLIVAQRAIDISRDKGYVTQLYVGDEVFADPRDSHHFEVTDGYIELTGSKTQYVTDHFQGAFHKGLPAKVLIFCKHKEQNEMHRTYREELSKESCLIDGKRPSLVRGVPGWYLEILHPDVDKGMGLMRMCSHLGISLDQCVAFGDGDNDYEFLQMAGKGIAMKNAREAVKKIANEVIEYTNDEDGVAKTLKALEEQGCFVFEES